MLDFMQQYSRLLVYFVISLSSKHIMTRNKSREVPPESQTMGNPRISVVFDMFGYGCGRNSNMVLPH